MKNYSKILPILGAVILTIFVSKNAFAQDGYKNYAFVIFETTVTQKNVETSDQNPSERRFYVSNVVDFPERDQFVFRSAMKIADEYFTANVVEPMKLKGILHQYYDDGIRINNKVIYDLVDRAAVEELQKKVLAELKDQNVNIFTFNWTRDKDTKGLETSQPTLFYRNPESPLYGSFDTKTAVPTAPKSNEKLKPSSKKRN